MATTPNTPKTPCPWTGDDGCKYPFAIWDRSSIMFLGRDTADIHANTFAEAMTCAVEMFEQDSAERVEIGFPNGDTMSLDARGVSFFEDEDDKDDEENAA